MATAQTLSYHEVHQLTVSFAAAAEPTDKDKIAFIKAVREQLQDGDMVQQFLANVREAGTTANEVDAAFDRVSRSFDDMVSKFGTDFPGFATFNNEWKDYNSVGVLYPAAFVFLIFSLSFFQRWVTYLSDSRDVASTHITLLRRKLVSYL